jgi:osmoprotectant transport system substrate-binding protein
MAALGASVLALVVSACGTGGGSSIAPTGTPASPTVPGATGTTPATETPAASASATAASPSATAESPSATAASPSATAASPSATAAGPTLASTLVLGAPPECPQRPFCALGLKETYGIEFKEIRALDAGGPLTVTAVENGTVDVGLLFTSDPAIAARGFVLLEDDRQLQLADNLIPVIRQETLQASPAIGDLLNPWMARLDQEQLTELNKRVSIDQDDAGDVVREWLATNGLQTGTGGEAISVTVGSTNFYEQEILGELFAQVLEANGYQVERKFQLGNREIVFPALESGQIDLLAEYAATALEFVNKGAGEASTDPAATAAKLRERLAPMGLTALEHAPATDQNGFVVTRATADRYGLAKLSDLAKPAP